jgi:hypothetical protein
MCGEDSLNSTNGLRLDKPKLKNWLNHKSKTSVVLICWGFIVS